MHTFVELEAYKEIKTTQEIKENHIFLTRSRKMLPKLKNFKLTQKFERQEEQSGELRDSGMEIRESHEEEKADSDSTTNNIIEFVQKIIKIIWDAVHFERMHFDDLLNIVRPFLYVFVVNKWGRKSYFPIKVALLVDLAAAVITFVRLNKGDRLKKVEREQMKKRVLYAFLKFLLRDPIFGEYTQPFISAFLTKIGFSTNILAFILSIINYSRYYTYIA